MIANIVAAAAVLAGSVALLALAVAAALHHDEPAQHPEEAPADA